MAYLRSHMNDILSKKIKIKNLTLKTVYITAALAVAVLVSLWITIANSNVADNPNENKGTAPQKSEITVTVNDTKKGALLIVNKNSDAFDFDINKEDSLLNIADSMPSEPLYALRNQDMKANKEALTALNNMAEDFYEQATDKEAAKKLTVWTAYRSLADQNALGSSTKGGHSDFHTGMLFELTIDNTVTSISQSNTYDWIYKNAHKYGFVERYHATKSSVTGVSDFDNAFRYVGVAHSTYMYEHNLCLEEYVEKLESYTKDSPLSITVGNSTYDAFYVKADPSEAIKLKVESRGKVSVSGNNDGGVIITVKK